ncbi:MAG: hypothetical protein ACRDLL_10090 [Solirubrobacterales bacterium]
MRTVISLRIGMDNLELKREALPTHAASELVELLLSQERLLHSDEQPFTKPEILDAFTQYAEEHPRPGRPTDPDGEQIINHVRRFLNIDHENHELLLLGSDPTVKLRYNALRHAISILSQIPQDAEDEVSDVTRIIEDKQEGIFGLMFQRENQFRFRLRYHTPEALKASSERVVAATTSRPADELNPAIRASATTAIAGVNGSLEAVFDEVLMKTPAGEIAQQGEVHTVGSRTGLAWYVAFRSPQYVLLWLSLGLVIVDLLLETITPQVEIVNLHFTTWLGGTLERLTTAAFTAYFFAVLLDYVKLRAKFSGTTAAFIDWETG